MYYFLPVYLLSYFVSIAQLLQIHWGPLTTSTLMQRKLLVVSGVLVVAELVITGVLLVVQYSYQDVILSNLMLTTH